MEVVCIYVSECVCVFVYVCLGVCVCVWACVCFPGCLCVWVGEAGLEWGEKMTFS